MHYANKLSVFCVNFAPLLPFPLLLLFYGFQDVFSNIESCDELNMNKYSVSVGHRIKEFCLLIVSRFASRGRDGRRGK
ncbi:hypothetical protein OWV82_011646 [Melia azedarach]|uniref:Uncharacterized protein n=1 Tax=Melia azedarach TaxID=155640 RepID=A0ACC1XZ26_MELAZ|nr:hypothetical protein OWV82_011646 [Melia azedarach]